MVVCTLYRRVATTFVLLSAAIAPVALRAAQPETLTIDSAAPDFSLPGVEDKTYTLGEFADAEIRGDMAQSPVRLVKRYALADFADADVLVIIFTCNHCPTAQAYEARIKQLAADYRDRGVAVVAISPNDPDAVRLDELGYSDLGDSLKEMVIRARDHEFNFPYLYDGQTQATSRAYGPVATPHVFIFDRQRKLRFCGRIDDHQDPRKTKTHDTRDAIDALLAGRPVTVETTRTFGCSIKWTDKAESARQALEKWDQETAELATIDAAGLGELVANKTDRLRVINVWATWCGPCVTELPELVTMHRMYRNRDFELVTISADAPENRDAARKFLNRQHASMTNYIFNVDDPDALADALGVEWPGALPFTLVVKPGGDVFYKSMGPIEPLALRRAIVDALSRYYFRMEP